MQSVHADPNDEEDEENSDGDRCGAAEDNMETQQTKVEEFPTFIPLQYSYKHDKYFVRECYEPYFELVMAKLSERHQEGVTISGTPGMSVGLLVCDCLLLIALCFLLSAGIGKSLFLAYFYLRYIEKHPSATVTFASYNMYRKLMKVAVRAPAIGGETSDVSVLARRGSDATMAFAYAAEIKAKREGRPCICLCDGPPSVEPQDVQYLVCTSPNEEWTSITCKNPFHTCYYMPVWTQEELLEAAVALKLDQGQLGSADYRLVNQETLERDFEIFGGVARPCLTQSVEFANRLKDVLEKPIMRAVDTKDLRRLAYSDKGTHTHHYHPDPAQPSQYSVRVASPHVERLLLRVAAELDQRDRETFVRNMASAVSTRVEVGTILRARSSEQRQ